ncbi:hypothetical protein CVU75_02735 [Candidatus Dependentiae bacterium HGW-Dependentiae-1]|nr:MAG: hypothetical protein CVU75_02735 [Candidatus Dependentiae bacterium HGW-Dependentiae-1]
MKKNLPTKVYVQARTILALMLLTAITLHKELQSLPTDTPQQQYDLLLEQAQKCIKQKLFDQAINSLSQALTLMPNKKELLPILAYAYYSKNDSESAWLTYQKAAQAFPNRADIHFNTGFLARLLGKFEQAFPEFKKVIELDPSYNKAREQLGYTYLTLGRLQEGWAQFRYLDRRDPSIDNAHRLYDIDPKGKTIMVKDIGGYGDLFQFIRHAEELKKRGAHIIFYARPEIIPLLSRCPFFDQIVSQKEPVPEFDYYTNIAKMREDLDISIETISCSTPYIHPDPMLIKKWANAFTGDTQFKIGISWQAQMYVDEKTGQPILCSRSISAEQIKKLVREFPFISFYSLQKNADCSTLAIHKNFHTFDDSFDKINGRFMDTAAVMKNLDLVITIDTSIAHLAGALGVPVWTMLRKFPDWRWFIEREDSPWYPTMRLFRQPKEGDWNTIIQNIINELPLFIIKEQAAH